MQFLLGQCHSAFEHHQGILLAMFIAGLVGGLTHCAGMCGPFVVAQVRAGTAPQESLKRLSGAALLPYHFGRMTTYVILGIIAALLSRQIMGTPLQQSISAMFLVLAGVMFIASALPQARSWFTSIRVTGVSHAGEMLGAIAKPLFSSPKGINGYGLGLLLGLLPCGLVFAALMAVSTTGSPFTAALAMTLFTLGTFPSLFLVGVGSHFAYRKWPDSMKVATRGVMILNGLNLFVLAGNMVL